VKLLFDENLSFKLIHRLSDVFPAMGHVRLLGLERAEDRTVWDYARAHGFAIVTLDADFVEMAGLLGAPPKIIRLRCGNQPTAFIDALLREHASLIDVFKDSDSACLEIY